MKKQLFFIAAAALVLASCSQDETIEVNTSEAISFRTFVNAQTRAENIETGNIQEFNVTARYESNNYFHTFFDQNLLIYFHQKNANRIHKPVRFLELNGICLPQAA